MMNKKIITLLTISLLLLTIFSIKLTSGAPKTYTHIDNNIKNNTDPKNHIPDEYKKIVKSFNENDLDIQFAGVGLFFKLDIGPPLLRLLPSIGVSLIIRNVGLDNITNIPFNFSVKGGIFKNINASDNGTIPYILSGGVLHVPLEIFGFGKIELNAQVGSITKNATGLIYQLLAIVLTIKNN